MSRQPKISNPRAAADPVAYMDRVRDSDFGREYKARALDLLDLSTGHVVLDVGCGPGDDVFEMEKRVGASGRAVGLDFHDVMIKEARSRAKKRGSSAEFVCADLFDSGLDAESIDRCHADRVLQLVQDPLQALREITKLLRPAGHLVASLPDLATWVFDFGAPETTAKILGLGRALRGVQLVNAFKDAGLVDLVFAPCANVGIDFEELNASTPLREMAKGAERAGAIDSLELDAWLRALDDAIARDRFTHSSTMMVLRGSQPSAGG